MINRISQTLILMLAMLTIPNVAQAPGYVVIGKDDPTTHINESTRLNASRFVSETVESHKSPGELANAYITEMGLVNCKPNAQAEMDDVVLTILVDPLTFQPVTDQIVMVSWEDALESSGVRTNIIACDAPEGWE